MRFRTRGPRVIVVVSAVVLVAMLAALGAQPYAVRGSEGWQPRAERKAWAGLAQPAAHATGSVLFVITIRGDIDKADDFSFALDTVPPGRIIEPIVWICGPKGPWGPIPRCRADHPYVRASGQWPVGTVLRYALWKGDVGPIPGLAGKVAITPGRQTYSLTYDYDLRLLPDTAVSCADAGPPTETAPPSGEPVKVRAAAPVTFESTPRR